MFLDRWLVSKEILARVQRLEIQFNRYGVDPFGARDHDIARMFTVFGWFYDRYFDVEVHGLDYIPPRGRCMLVGNHSGGYAIDAMMTMSSIFFAHEPPRLAQGMAERFLNRLPVSSLLTTRSGQLTGLPEHAERLLTNERMLMVFPEGARGTAKLYPERNSLVSFGTGFMRLALKTRTPIIPVGFIGGGDAVPTMMNLYRIGKWLGVPYIPVTPYLLPLPRPTKLQIYFCKPIELPGNGNEEDDIIEAHVDVVKEAIADAIERGLRVRNSDNPQLRSGGT